MGFNLNQIFLNSLKLPEATNINSEGISPYLKIRVLLGYFVIVEEAAN